MKDPKLFLIFLGCPGSGKTHFCHAVFNDMKREGHFYKRIWNESTFVSSVKSSFDSSGTSENEILYMCDDDLVVFDDMGSTSITEWKKDILFQFVDIRYKSKKPTIITSNFNENDIRDKLGSRIHSRIFDKENIILSFGCLDWRSIEVNERP